MINSPLKPKFMSETINLWKKVAEKFGGKEKMSTFAIPNENNTFETQNPVP